MEGRQQNQAVVEMLLDLISGPKDSHMLASVVKGFRATYHGSLKGVVAQIAQEHHQKAKALARELDWADLHLAILAEQLEQSLAANSLKGVLQATAELRDVLGPFTDEARDIKAGLLMQEFDCPGLERLPNFADMRPTRESTAEQVRYVQGQRRINSDGAVFRGLLHVDREGEYKVWTESLDGSLLKLDGVTVVDNDGRRHGHHYLGPAGAQEREGRAILTSGFHELRLEWFAHDHRANGHAPQLVLRYEGPDTDGRKVEVPADALFQGNLQVIPEQLTLNATAFLQERLVPGSNEEAILPALSFHTGSVSSLLARAPRETRKQLVACVIRKPHEFNMGSKPSQEARRASGDVDEDLVEAFLDFAEQSPPQDALQAAVRALHHLCRQPPQIAARRLAGSAPPQAQMRQRVREAAEAVEWQGLVSALQVVDYVDSFEAGSLGIKWRGLLSALKVVDSADSSQDLEGTSHEPEGDQAGEDAGKATTAPGSDQTLAVGGGSGGEVPADAASSAGSSAAPGASSDPLPKVGGGSGGEVPPDAASSAGSSSEPGASSDPLPKAMAAFSDVSSSFPAASGDHPPEQHLSLLCKSLESMRKDYVSNGTLNATMLAEYGDDLILNAMLLFPSATRLFLPKDRANLTETTRTLLPHLKTAHLGTLMSPQELEELKGEYAATKELWVKTKLTPPALSELLELCPEPSVVAIEGVSGPRPDAELENPDVGESPVFEIGDSVPEFTCVFEFKVHRHQQPEVYEVCAGQVGDGLTFVVGWTKHWADGRDSIILKHEGNQGHGGRIMHGGATCGFDMSQQLQDGEWHRVAVVYDANLKTCTLHVDGWERTEMHTWNQCNPLRLERVTIGEQGAWTREGRRNDRRFPPGQLRNVKLFSQILPRELLFEECGSLELAGVRQLRLERPNLQIISQSAVPPPELRRLLQRYRQDSTVDLSEFRDLTKAGLSSLVGFFPHAERIFLSTCGCTRDLRVLPPPIGAAAGLRDLSAPPDPPDLGRKRRTQPEWRDLAAVFVTRAIARKLGECEADQPSAESSAAHEIVDLTLQLSSLGAEATDELDKPRAGLLLVRRALAEPDCAQVGLVSVAAFLHRDGRSYLSALAAKQRAVLARLIFASEHGFGLQAARARPGAKRSPEDARAEASLLEAFVAAVQEASGSSQIARPLKQLRALFRGPVADVVEAFDWVSAEDQWGAVRDAAKDIEWSDLQSAFSMALMKPRTTKLKVKRQQCVTEEVVEAYEAPQARSQHDRPAECVVCAGDAQYRLSTECAHYFCADCAGRGLQAIKDAGQFPAHCPGCRADSAAKGLKAPPAGLVQTPALALLEKRGVISFDFQLQFLRQHTKDPENYFSCPGKCGKHLVACAQQFMAVPKGEHEHEGFKRMTRLGECPCGAKMCVKCRVVVETGHRGGHQHTCPPDAVKDDPHEAESIKAMERLGKRCPNCGLFLERDGGCDIIMCGTEAHGSLEKALANGGCGYQFHWESGEPAHSFYIGLNGQRVEGIVGRIG